MGEFQVFDKHSAELPVSSGIEAKAWVLKKIIAASGGML